MRPSFKVGLWVLIVGCAPGEKHHQGGGAAGEATSGTAGTLGGSGASDNGGTSGRGGTSEPGGAGDDQGGSSGTAQGGSGGGSGSGTGASAGKGGTAAGGVAGTGGSDDRTVRGVVRRTDSNDPNENVIVAIGAATTYTDAEGRFEIPDVAPVYDLVLIVPEESSALVIRGTSERTLSLRAPKTGSDVLRIASVNGLVTGGRGAPISADRYARAA
ncbi:MAG TPA: hypothetical protein VF103_11645, partial [Polyangiaceae bacterium]